MKFFFILVIYFGIGLSDFNAAFAGRLNKVDSLRAELYRADDVTRKISLYLLISRAFEEINTDSAVIFWKEAQNLATRLKTEKPLADVYAQGAYFSLKQTKLDRAFLYFTLAAKYYGSTGDKANYTLMKFLMGNICQVQNNIAEAMSCFIEVIDLSERMKLYNILPHALNNVGNIYMETEDYNNAMEYYLKALALFRKTGDSIDSSYPLINLGEVYYYLDDLEIAKDYTLQARRMSDNSKDNCLKSRVFMILGMIHREQHDYNGAIDFLNKSLEIEKLEAKINWPPRSQYAELLANLGEMWYQVGDLRKSRMYNFEGYNIARSMKQVRWAMTTAIQLSRIYKRNNRLDSALFYYEIYMAQADSLTKSGNIRAVKLLKVRQEYEKKQQENELRIALEKSAKHTMFIIYIATGIVFIAVILILFLMLKLERQKKQKAEIEKQSLNEKLEFQNKELTRVC